MRKLISAVAVVGALLAMIATTSIVDPATGATPAGGAPAAVRAALRADLDDYLTAYQGTEHISGISLAVTFHGPAPAVHMAVGTARYDGGRAMSPGALWQIGSNTKAFTSVMLLQLESEHRLSIHDTLGQWLPQYPAWSGVTIKRLLNMTSGIPNYTDSPNYWHALGATPDADFSASRLISYALAMPATQGYSYSNTNYILAQMIIERATHDSYGTELRKRIIRPLGLRDTFYSATRYNRKITARTPAGYWFVAPIPGSTFQLGVDQSRLTLSWAQGAGGIISSLGDLAKWDDALYSGEELPRQQQRELTSLVSTATGQPIKTTSLSDDAGYGLGVSQVTSPSLGTLWYYEGETDGFRVLNIYLPQSGTAITLGVNSATLNDHTSELGTSVYQTLHAAGLS